MKKIELFNFSLVILICVFIVSCATLPKVTKVNSGNIDKKGILFMLPKAELYLNFGVYKTDSVKGLVAGNQKLIDKLNTLYFLSEKKRIVKNTCTAYKYSDFSFIERYVQDTSELYSVNISKKAFSFFTNLEYAMSISEDGVIQSTDMTAENSTVAVFASIAGYAFNSIVPHLPSQQTRGAGDTTQSALAGKLLDSLQKIKNLQRIYTNNPKYNDNDLESSQYILNNLSATEDELLDMLVGKYHTTMADSVVLPINPGKDTIYVIENRKNGKRTYAELSGSDGQFSDYLCKIASVWLSKFENKYDCDKSSGMPYKMPEHTRLKVFNQANELVTESDVILPSKSTFHLPAKLHAGKTSLKVEYNADGTINNISGGYQSSTPDEVKTMLNNFDPTLIKTKTKEHTNSEE